MLFLLDPFPPHGNWLKKKRESFFINTVIIFIVFGFSVFHQKNKKGGKCPHLATKCMEEKYSIFIKQYIVMIASYFQLFIMKYLLLILYPEIILPEI